GGRAEGGTAAGGGTAEAGPAAEGGPTGWWTPDPLGCGKTLIKSPAVRRGFHFWKKPAASHMLDGWLRRRHSRCFISMAIRRTILFSISSTLKPSLRARPFTTGPFALIAIETCFRSF